MPIFGNSKFLPVILYQKGLNKFGMHIFGHSKFIPVFLGKIFRKNSELPFLAIPNLYQSSWEKLSEKIWKGHLWPYQICTSLPGKNCQKKLPLLAILHLYQCFWEKLSEKIWKGHFWQFQICTSLPGKNCHKKIGTAIVGHSEFIPVFFEKIVFGENCQKKFGMAIFGYSEFF